MLVIHRSQQKKKKSVLTIPEATADEIVLEEGQEVVFKTPAARKGSNAKDQSPEEQAAIQELLDKGSDVDDDEIEEATKRLLACTLLQDDIDDIWDNSDVEYGSREEHNRHDVENGDIGSEYENMEETVSEDDANDAPPPPRQAINDDDAPPNEMTSLLGHEASGSGTSMSSHNEELLRPSIFTTVSEIDSQRRSQNLN